MLTDNTPTQPSILTDLTARSLDTFCKSQNIHAYHKLAVKVMSMDGCVSACVWTLGFI